MLIILHIRATREFLHILVPMAGMRIEAPAVVAYGRSDRKVWAYGKAVDEFVSGWGEEWERYKDQIAFCSPFDPDGFDPDFALATLRYYSAMARGRARPGGWGRVIGFLVDRFVYNFWLVGYGNLPPEVRTRFEQGLRTLPRVRRFLINGQPLSRAKGR